MPAPSAFAAKLAGVAREQHTKFQFLDEADPPLCNQIRKYHTDLGLPFQSCAGAPWGSVFVSWCVRQAGATRAEFEFSAVAAVFAHEAIKNASSGTAAFRGFDIAARPPAVGDIILFNRGGAKVDFGFASTHQSYVAHPVIVVEVGGDEEGAFALVIGGNEGDSIRRTKVRLDAQRLIRQRDANPFICIIKTLK